MNEHRYLGVEATVHHGVVAVCACGWRSRTYASAGLAGSAWDDHSNEVEAADDR